MTNIDANLHQSIDEKVKLLIEEHVKQTVGQYTYTIQKQITQRLDVVLEDVVARVLRDSAGFPQASIPATSINWENYTIDSQLISDMPKANQGIEDHSDQVNLTIMNDAVVVENKVISRQMEADTIRTDKLELTSTDQPWISAIAQRVEQSVRQHDYSVDINKVAVKFDEQVNEIRGEIKRSTELKELDVAGEAYLSGVLYTTPGNKRVGINTMDPSDALCVWDQEAEVVIGKHANQEGYIGTRRRQALNIGSNNNVGIKISAQGEVEINKLNLCGRTIGTSEHVPGDAAKQGDIRLNTKPQNGAPIGWVCIDGNRWSAFGIIE
mgnify:CR=1 FL=1|tara:strand:- start:473 stop:1444 length:972 start_codon:yes stop_codon:yes gene_type:complete